jgi:hypothetical protein
MHHKLVFPAILLAIVSLTRPSQAEDSPVERSTQQLAQAQPPAREVLAACVENRADTLPNPYVDVPVTHWAYKAVVTLYYCGAIRQGTPPQVIDRLLNSPAPQPQSPSAQ